MIKISAVIIARNEESKIELCLQSLVGIADEIIVVDSFSTDSTKDVCLRYGIRFFERKWGGYGDQKNWGNKQATNDYILSLDADEYLSIELRESILAIKNSCTHHAYNFNRLNFFCGKPLKHGGWYPDCKVRLWDKRKGQWSNASVHELVQLEKDVQVGHLKGDLIHYSFSSVADHINRSAKYADLWVEKAVKRGKKVSFAKLLYVMPWKFFAQYIIRLGCLDGSAGLMVSAGSAYAAFMKYAMLYQYRVMSKSIKVKKIDASKDSARVDGFTIRITASCFERLLLCLRSIKENSHYEHQIVLEGEKFAELQAWVKEQVLFNPTTICIAGDEKTLAKPLSYEVALKDDLYVTRNWDQFLMQEL